MIDILFLVVAIVLLIAMQMFRGMLAYVFPTATVRRVALAKAPDGVADLYADAHAQLQALGFAGPQWNLLRLSGDIEDTAHFYAVYAHAGGDVCRLFPASAVDKPNRLNVVFATRLADGRTAVSQPFDPFFEMTASPERPSRTIAGATLAEQRQVHHAFIATLGAPVDPSGATPASIAAFDEDIYNGARQRMLDEGKLWIDRRGWARPTLAFAWRMLLAVQRRPKPAPNTDPVPPARLAALAVMLQRFNERPAPARMQAGLFALSVALFLAIGAVFWSVEMALTLLVVIAIHELGHYLAMRVFGYRNVQMLALPLVGGVTIGHEVKPDAARRAWMSLMGPLPGVLIGWAMLLAMPHVDVPSWWMSAAWVFLAVNYLNVLPVPPLDGGHVVQALLPARAAKVQAVFIVFACITGAVAAYQLGFMLLVVLALLQLTLASTHWQLARVIDRAHGDAGLDPQRPRALRLRRLFEIADDLIGPTAKAAPRIGQATQALQSLDVKPMHWLQRTVIGTVYAALLAGPVIALTFVWGVMRPDRADPAKLSAELARREQQRSAFAAQASTLDLDRLLRGDVAGADLPPPATDAAITAAQERLGGALPEELAGLYRAHDGVPPYRLLPVASVVRLRDAPAAELDLLMPDGSLPLEFDPDPVTGARREPVPVTRDRVGEWLLLSTPEDASFVVYDAGAEPAVAGYRVIEFYDGLPGLHRDLRAWFESNWTMQQEARANRQRYVENLTAAEDKLAGLSLPALLDRLPQPSLMQRLFTSKAQRGLPPPADAAAITAAESRLGATLPDDARMLYTRHDGLSSLRLFALAEQHRLDLADASVRDQIAASLSMRTPASQMQWPTSIDELATCIVVGGYAREPKVMNLLWCPTPDGSRYVDLSVLRTHASLTDYVRMQIAMREVHRL
jgi:Zn-dependent protease